MTQPPTPSYGDRRDDRVDPYIDTVPEPVVTEAVVTEPVVAEPVATQPWTTGVDDTLGDSGVDASNQCTKDAATHEASEVKDTAVQAGQQVAGTAKEQAQNVAAEAGQQTKQLWQQTVSELGTQASGQQQRLAGTLTSFSKELGSMASSSKESGLMTDLAHQASQRGGEIAHWLENREPKDVLEDVKSFARRRPFAFLAIATTAGVLAGRLTRGLATNAKAEHDTVSTPQSPPHLDQTTQPAWTPPAEPVRESMSLQEVPTSGTGTGPTFYAPDTDPQADQGVVGDPYGRPESQGGVR